MAPRTREEGARAALVATASTLVFVVVAAVAVVRSPNWPKVRDQFFSREDFVASWPDVLSGFWMDMRMFALGLIAIPVLIGITMAAFFVLSAAPGDPVLARLDPEVLSRLTPADIEDGAWRGFRPGLWRTEINVRDFIQQNYEPYHGDGTFLASATARTQKICDTLKALFLEERKKGVLDISQVPSSTTSIPLPPRRRSGPAGCSRMLNSRRIEEAR